MIRRWSGIILGAAALLGLLGGFALEARATVIEESFRGVDCRLYFPDWVWQGHDANLLMSFQSDREFTDRIEASIELPEGHPPFFLYSGPLVKTLDIYPFEKKHMVFSGLRINPVRPPDSAAIRVRVQGEKIWMDKLLEIKSVQGARLDEGPRTLYLLALLCAVWSLFIGAWLIRRSQPGAWKKLPPEFAPPPEILRDL